MNIKTIRIAAFAAAVTMCSAMLTACSGDDTANNESETTTSSATTVSDVPDISDDETSAETSDTEGETSANEETVGEEAASALQIAAESAVDGQDWPAMAAVSNDEKEYISDFFLLDTENANYKDLFIYQCPMSANLSEIIIIEADDVSSAKADLEARQKKAQEQDAFYPDDVERAGASIVGTEGSYAYFIMGNNADKVESALEKSLE